jgi:hypothetical protein
MNVGIEIRPIRSQVGIEVVKFRGIQKIDGAVDSIKVYGESRDGSRVKRSHMFHSLFLDCNAANVLVFRIRRSGTFQSKKSPHTKAATATVETTRNKAHAFFLEERGAFMATSCCCCCCCWASTLTMILGT